ncbi:MAG: tetratricopeptide repeat-containing sensor histidine kinase [Bacteroidia bacterium]
MNRRLISYFLLLNIFIGFGQVDSLEQLLKKNIADTTRLKVLDDLSWNYAALNIEKSEEYAKQLLQLAQKTNNQKYIAVGYNNLGIVQIKRSDYKGGLEYQKKALEIRLKLKNEMDIASSYSKIAYCLTSLSDYVGAYEAALKCLAIYERLNNKVYIAFTLNTICNACYNLKYYDRLMEYSTRGYKLAMESGNKEAEGGALNYIASAYLGGKKYAEAANFFKQCYQSFESIADSNQMASALNNIGYSYMGLKKPKEALDYYLRALKIVENIGDLNSQATYEHNIAYLYYYFNEYQKAIQYNKKAEQLAMQQSMPDILLQVYKTYGQLYAGEGNSDKATEYFNRYELLHDSIYSQELTKQFSEMQVKYETEKKETQNKLLKNENDLKTAQLSRSKILQIFLGSVILMVIVVAYLLFVRAKLKQKQVLDAELLRQQELRSKAVIEAEEQERIRIARELHDGIGQQLSAAKLNISGLQGSIKTSKPGEITMLQNALDLLDESVKEVRAVSHNMMPNALFKSGLVSAVREFINKISSSGNLKINLQIVGLTNRLESTVENILFRVLQELVNNIIKHAHASEVGIQFIKHEKELTILIEDNGVGFDVEKQLAETDGGMGLKNIETRIAFLRGEVIFDSYPGKGTTVTIEIPL